MGVIFTSSNGIQFRRTLKGKKCLFYSINIYKYQYQAFPGLTGRVLIIQFVTASHREQQLEVLLELYIDPGTAQVDPRTLLPGNISSRLGNNFLPFVGLLEYEWG